MPTSTRAAGEGGGLVLADDLTGALEAGAILAAQGVATLVTLDTNHAALDGVLVMDTETRHSTPQAARDLHHEIAARWRGPIFKKTDSTLRGNIGAEFTGLMEATGRRLIYIPAYPRVGRMVAGGILYVDGVPLAETAFARDPRNPVRESSVGRVIARDCALPVEIRDAATELDMAAIAEEIDPGALVASPAGFIGYWAAKLALPRSRRPRLPVARSFLLACGSLHPRSREQAGEAERLGWTVVSTSEDRAGDADEAAVALAKMVSSRVAEADTLVVFGGDTARAILQELGAGDIEPLGEVAAGVPVSRIQLREGRPLTLITKAGGFGAVDLASRIRATLEKE